MKHRRLKAYAAVLGLCCAWGCGLRHARAEPGTQPAAAPLSAASASASGAGAGGGGGAGGSPSPVASGSPTASATVTPAEAKQLLGEFQKAQYSELKALEHRHKLEIKELKASHAARVREWEKREQEARHKFFADHPHGPDRRAYIQDFIERHKAFDQILADERQKRIHEQDVRLKAVKDDQVAKLKEFKEALKKGQRPPASLWPQ